MDHSASQSWHQRDGTSPIRLRGTVPEVLRTFHQVNGVRLHYSSRQGSRCLMHALQNGIGGVHHAAAGQRHTLIVQTCAAPAIVQTESGYDKKRDGRDSTNNFSWVDGGYRRHDRLWWHRLPRPVLPATAKWCDGAFCPASANGRLGDADLWHLPLIRQGPLAW